MRDDRMVRRALDIASELYKRGVQVEVRGYNIHVGDSSIIEVTQFLAKYSGPRRTKVWTFSDSPVVVASCVVEIMAQERDEEARYQARLAAEAAEPAQPEVPPREKHWADDYYGPDAVGKRTGD